MTRNKYPGCCCRCGQWVEIGYGYFEKVHSPAHGKPKWRIKCGRCASGRELTDKGRGMIRAKKAAQK